MRSLLYIGLCVGLIGCGGGGNSVTMMEEVLVLPPVVAEPEPKPEPEVEPEPSQGPPSVELGETPVVDLEPEPPTVQLPPFDYESYGAWVVAGMSSISRFYYDPSWGPPSYVFPNSLAVEVGSAPFFLNAVFSGVVFGYEPETAQRKNGGIRMEFDGSVTDEVAITFSGDVPLMPMKARIESPIDKFPYWRVSDHEGITDHNGRVSSQYIGGTFRTQDDISGVIRSTCEAGCNDFHGVFEASR